MLSQEEHQDSLDDYVKEPIKFKFKSRNEKMNNIKLQSLEIVLHENQINYETGDIIHGKCILVLEGTIRRSLINILLTCVGEIKWIEQGSHIRYHNHIAHEFREKKVFMELLFKHPLECENEILESGVHSIDFGFELPRGVGLPSTFQGVHGTICYFLEANITEDINLPAIYRTLPLVICVAAPVRTNLWLPIGTDAEKEVGYLNTSIVKMHVFLNKKGYFPGENVKINIVTINESSHKVIPRVTLYRIQVFMTKNRHHSIERHYEPVKGNAVCNGKPGIDQIILEIPSDAPLTIKNELMVVKYYLWITLDIPMELDLHINLPIIITTKRALEETKLSPTSKHTSFEINE